MATLQVLAELVDGTLAGDPGVEIDHVAPIDQAGPGSITFVANPKYLSKLQDCQATAVILAPGIESPIENLIICKNPYLAFARILTHLHVPDLPELGVLAGATVADSAQIDQSVTIYPGCVVGERVRIGSGTTLYPGVVIYDDVQIGDNCILHANSVIRERCRLGDRVILQPGAIIGSDGFGFAPDGQSYYKIPQVGIVHLEADVEIIGRGTKLENLVQIAHNVRIGEDCIIVSQVGIAGSTQVGNHCTFGGQTAIAGHLKIGENVMIGARGGAAGNVEPNQVMSGAPLLPHKQWQKAAMTFGKLPEMRKDLQLMKKRLDELEALLKED